jgi:hypothetical protein
MDPFMDIDPTGIQRLDKEDGTSYAKAAGITRIKR